MREDAVRLTVTGCLGLKILWSCLYKKHVFLGLLFRMCKKRIIVYLLFICYLFGQLIMILLLISFLKVAVLVHSNWTMMRVEFLLPESFINFLYCVNVFSRSEKTLLYNDIDISLFYTSYVMLLVSQVMILIYFNNACISLNRFI